MPIVWHNNHLLLSLDNVLKSKPAVGSKFSFSLVSEFLYSYVSAVLLVIHVSLADFVMCLTSPSLLADAVAPRQCVPVEVHSLAGGDRSSVGFADALFAVHRTAQHYH